MVPPAFVPMLAGVPVPDDDDTQTLAELLRHAEFPVTAQKLEQALVAGVKTVPLTIVDRESMLWALDETPTDGLAALRAVLLRAHEWRVREGLV